MSDAAKKRIGEADLESVSGGAGGLQKIAYTVRRGDTLVQIANHYGVSVMDLVSWNNIQNPDGIQAGQVLVIYQGSRSVKL